MQASWRRDLLIAALLGLIVAAAAALATLSLHQAATRDSLPSLVQTNQAGVEAIGRSVADQLARALGYGIPLESLHGVEPYLAALVDGAPSLQGMALATLDGRTLHSAGHSATPSGTSMAFSVLVEGVPRAELVLTPAPPLVGPAIDRLWVALLANSAVTGLIGAVVVLAFLRRHHDAARDRLRTQFSDARADRYRSLPPVTETGAVARAFAAYDGALDPVRNATRSLSDAVATVRAIDFDGSLSERVSTLTEPAGSLLAISDPDRTDRADRTEQARGAAWLLVGLLGLYATALPFVANFAIDRQSNLVPSAFWPVLPPIVEASAGLLAFVIGRRLPDWARRPAAAAGLLAVAVACAMVFGTRDYTLFLGYRVGAAAGLGVAAGAMLGAGAVRTARPWVPTVLIAVLTVGPVVGGLLGEAFGRRAAFLTIGCAFAMASLAPLFLHPTTGGRASRPAPPALQGRVFAVAAGMAAGGTFLVWMPIRLGYEDYLADGLWIGLAGLAAAAVRLRRPPVSAGLLVAGLVLTGLPTQLPELWWLGLVGIGLGLRGLLDGGPATPGGVDWPMAIIGSALGSLAVGAGESVGLPPLMGLAALCTAVVAAGGLLPPRRDR